MTASIIPKLKPGASRQRVTAIVDTFAERLEGCQFVIVACRGYFRDSMGKIGANDRGIYDDAIFFVTPQIFSSFNANCDPSLFEENIASIKADQVVWFKKGDHGLAYRPPRRHPAFRQSRPIAVVRDDGKGGFREEKPSWPYTNLHRGGQDSTNSEGCLTIPPSQWEGARELGYEQMDEYGQDEVPCILVELQG